MRIKLDNTIDYYYYTPTEKKNLPVVNKTSVPCTLHTLKHVEKFKFTRGIEISFHLHC